MTDFRISTKNNKHTKKQKTRNGERERKLERKRLTQPRRPVARPSAYRRRWLTSLSFRSIPRVVVPICQVSPTCTRIWGRVSLREEIGSLRLFFLWIRGEEVRQVDLRFSVVLVPGCRGSHSSCIAVQVPGLWRLRQLCSAA